MRHGSIWRSSLYCASAICSIAHALVRLGRRSPEWRDGGGAARLAASFAHKEPVAGASMGETFTMMQLTRRNLFASAAAVGATAAMPGLTGRAQAAASASKGTG